MSRYRHEIDNARAHITSLWGVIILLSILLFLMYRGWSNAPDDLTIHIPPDISIGAAVSVDEIPEPNVYTFGLYMWQQINRWPESGDADYSKRLYNYAAYITPAFRAELLRDLEKRGRQGELTGRERALFEAPGAQYDDDRVQVIGPNVWLVTIDAVLKESVAGLPVKDTRIRYPLRVVRYDVDREQNPWGMAIDGFHQPPYRITDEEASQ